jgi:NPCBM/NEW2 domain
MPQQHGMPFDPYHKWLGIPKDERPPTHYRLLGLEFGESDAEVIEEAAIRQTSHVRAYQVGPHSADCTRILNEIAQARAVLLNPRKKRDYDRSIAPKTASAIKAPITPRADRDAPEAAREFKFEESGILPKPRETRRPERPNRPLVLYGAIGGVGVLLLGGLLLILFRSSGGDNALIPALTHDIVLTAPRVTVAAGDSAKLVVAVDRKKYAGRLQCTLTQLPKDVKASAVTIAPNQKNAEFLITAEAEAVVVAEIPIVIQATTPDATHVEVATTLAVSPPRPHVDALAWLGTAPASLFPGAATEARMAVLKNPTDGAALETLGRHVLLRTNESDHGIGLLLRAGSPKLREIARLEHAGGKELATQRILAAKWHQLARESAGEARKDCLRRAHYWSIISADASENASRRLDEIRAELPELSPVQLLPLLDPARHTRQGSAAFVDGKLRMFSRPAAHFELPFVPPPEYEIRYRVERMSGSESMHIGLGNGSEDFMAVLDGWPNDNRSGLDLVDGVEAFNNLTTSPGRFLVNREVALVRALVTRQGTKLFVGARKIVDWQGSSTRLSLREQEQKLQKHPHSLFFGAIGSYLIHSIELVPLDRGGQKLEEAPAPVTPPSPAQERVYLSDLPELDVQVGAGRFGKNGEQPSDGTDVDWITVAGKVAPKGIYIHPPPRGESRVCYRLDGKYARFESQGGISGTSGGCDSPLTFEVWGDGRILWKSPPIRSGSTQRCSVSVEGVQELKLRVDCQDGNGWAHAAWADPCVIAAPAP